MTDEEKEFAEYLGESFNNPDYGYLLYKGDPIQFQVGFNEWQRERAFFRHSQKL